MWKKPSQTRQARRPEAKLRRDDRGAMLIEAAFVLPLVILLLTGLLAYGNWFMTAHMVQNAASTAARAAMAGLSTAERRTLVDSSVTASLAAAPRITAQQVTTTVAQNGIYYTVTLSCHIADMPLFSMALVPMPGTDIRRSAVVRLENP